MEDKKLLEELVKTADAFRDFMTNLIDELAKVLADIKAPKEEDTWEMKCPYDYGDHYHYIETSGNIISCDWDGLDVEKRAYYQGNTFSTKQAAELESKRRNLLTRFRAFRDECNGDWKVDWNDVDQGKHIIKCGNERDLYVVSYWTVNEFNLFGYFKDNKDAQRAIDLFGDEIKELFVECD